MKVSKNNKQPGPDKVTMELLKWLNKDNKLILLGLFNDWLRNQNAADKLLLAGDAPISKQGDTDSAANDKPISLLSSCYKLYMVLVRCRMQDAIGRSLCKAQYGFRPSRSTSHALYIIRRMQVFFLKWRELD